MFLPQVSERVLFLANTIPSYLRIWSISIALKNGKQISFQLVQQMISINKTFSLQVAVLREIILQYLLNKTCISVSPAGFFALEGGEGRKEVQQNLLSLYSPARGNSFTQTDRSYFKVFEQPLVIEVPFWHIVERKKLCVKISISNSFKTSWYDVLLAYNRLLHGKPACEGLGTQI